MSKIECLKKTKPNVQASVLIKQIAKEWKEGKDVDTKQYNKNAEKDKKRFQRQLKEFQKLGYYTKDKAETEEEKEDTKSKKSKKSQKKRSSSKASTKKSKSQRSQSKAKSKKKSQDVSSSKKSKK